MNSISSSKNTAILLTIALAGALLFALYYYVVKPKQESVQQVSYEVNVLQSEVASVENQLEALQQQQSAQSENEFTLRKKVPENRAIDSILLNIEEIEYITGTRIDSINFNNYDELVSSSNLYDPTMKSSVEEQTGTADENSTATTETTEQDMLPVSTITIDALPPSLKLITFNIDITSPNEESLIKFIKEIEQIERIMHVDAIDLSLPGEENTFIEDKTEIVSGSVQVTTFYYE
jgi:type IV pilus assembly protein PilO